MRTTLAAARNEESVMPVFLNPKYRGFERRSGLNWPRLQPGEHEKTHGTFLHIGLVNNMADGAMGATEHQFLTLLEAASGDLLIQFTLTICPRWSENPLASARRQRFTRALNNFGNSRQTSIPTD